MARDTLWYVELGLGSRAVRSFLCIGHQAVVHTWPPSAPQMPDCHNIGHLDGQMNSTAADRALACFMHSTGICVTTGVLLVIRQSPESAITAKHAVLHLVLLISHFQVLC